MSARPDFNRLADEDLDLLVSRYIDGDLTPDEAAELERHLASDPRARQRHAATVSLIEKLQRLPAPEPPFALATRVSTQVAERSSGLGSVWHRFGLYPPPGAVAAAAGVLAFVGVLGIYFLGGSTRTPKATIAQNTQKAQDGPVRVFFEDGSTSSAGAPSSPPAAQPRAKQEVAEQGKSLAEPEMKRRASEETEADRLSSGKLAAAAKKADERADDVAEGRARENAPAEGAAPRSSFAPEPMGERASVDSYRVAQGAAAAKPERSMAAAAPAPPARAAARDEAAAKEKAGEAQKTADLRQLVPAVTVTGAAGAWRLSETPKRGLDAPIDATYRLGLDASGHVVSVAPQARKDQDRADVERYLLSLRFERAASSRGQDAGAVEVRVVAR